MKFVTTILSLFLILSFMSCNTSKKEFSKKEQCTVALYSEGYQALKAMDPDNWSTHLKKINDHAPEQLKEFYLDQYDTNKKQIMEANELLTLKQANCMEKELETGFKNQNNTVKIIQNIEKNCIFNRGLSSESKKGAQCKRLLAQEHLESMLNPDSDGKITLTKNYRAKEIVFTKGKPLFQVNAYHAKRYHAHLKECLMSLNINDDNFKRATSDFNEKQMICVDQHADNLLQTINKNCPKKEQSCLVKESNTFSEKIAENCIILPSKKRHPKALTQCKIYLANNFYEEMGYDDIPKKLKLLKELNSTTHKLQIAKCLIHSKKTDKLNQEQSDCIYKHAKKDYQIVEKRCPKQKADCLKQYSDEVFNKITKQCMIPAIIKADPQRSDHCKRYNVWSIFVTLKAVRPDYRIELLKMYHNQKNIDLWYNKCMRKPFSNTILDRMTRNHFDEKRANCVHKYCIDTFKIAQKSCLEKDSDCLIKIIDPEKMVMQCPEPI